MCITVTSSIYCIEEIESQIFSIYFVCEDWRGICSLPDKILLMQLGTKTAFGVNAINWQYKSTCMALLIPQDIFQQTNWKAYLSYCMPLHSKLKQKFIVKPHTQTQILWAAHDTDL